MWMMMSFHTQFDLKKETMLRFTRELCKKYKNNSYHNFRHGVDVMQARDSLRKACGVVAVVRVGLSLC